MRASWTMGGVLLLLAITAGVYRLAGRTAVESPRPTATRVDPPGASARESQEVGPPFERPNVIVVYTDDQRWDTLEHMPAVERMAAEGVSFTNSFVTSPVCGPSRASLLTGRLSSTQGIDLNEGASGQFDPSRSIAVELQERGYVTALFGKYLNGYRDQFPRVPPGWSEWRVFRDARVDLFRSGSLYTDPMFSWNGRSRREVGYSTDLLADYALEFVEANAERPFFLLLSFWAPHVPLNPAERHDGVLEGLALQRPPSFEESQMSDKPPWLREAAGKADLDRLWGSLFRRYLEVLQSVDEAVSRIRSKLETLDLDRDTVIVFTSDNGFMFGEHWSVGKGVPYEESIRVPLVIWSPRIPPRRVEEMVLNIDIAPTIAELAGTRIESDGRSLLPLLLGEDVEWRRSFAIEWETGFGLPVAYRAVRSETSKVIEWDGGHREVYDLIADPYEEHGTDDPRDVPGAGRDR
jgi:arylsulfatase A-like enzyme